METTGCGTAIVTPFRADGAIDEQALRALVNWQIDAGIDFLVVCGSTGEAATLDEEEWLRADWTENKPDATNCGDYHRVVVGGAQVWRFYPAMTHGTTAATAWARNQWVAGGLFTAGNVSDHADNTVDEIMSAPLAAGQPQHRCFLGGDPNLIAVERNANGGVAVAGVVHATKATARPLVNVTTVGTGTPVVSAAEDAASLGMSLIAVFFPILVVVALLLVGWAAWGLIRRARARRRRPAAW